jgi:hypothetical protein
MATRFERNFDIAWTAGHVLAWLQVALSLLLPTSFRYVIVATLALQLFALWSLVLAALSPFALVPLVRDRHARIAHGLEHATIAILRAQNIAVSEGGSRTDRFFVVLPEPTSSNAIKKAARSAIARITAGETGLAYAPKCGTSRILGRAVAGLVIVGVGITGWVYGIPHGVVFALSVMAVVLGRSVAAPLGMLGQRWWTVSTAFTAARIASVTRHIDDTTRRTRFEVTLAITPA